MRRSAAGRVAVDQGLLHTHHRATEAAEYDYYLRRRALGERFIPTPDAVIKAMVQAVLDQLEPPGAPEPAAGSAPRTRTRTVIVAPQPRRRPR
jgi:hypothetical protein